jgi:hypothetical protein
MAPSLPGSPLYGLDFHSPKIAMIGSGILSKTMQGLNLVFIIGMKFYSGGLEIKN